VNPKLHGIRGVLCDLDGTLDVGDSPLPGAIEAVDRLRAAGIGLRFLTNTTRRSRDAILEMLRGMGFRVSAEQIVTAPRAAAGRG
jgi:ribonucleotide monophosphatase NagD (HAD superfamily)